LSLARELSLLTNHFGGYLYLGEAGNAYARGTNEDVNEDLSGKSMRMQVTEEQRILWEDDSA